MVDEMSILYMGISAFLCFVIPIFLVVLFRKREAIHFKYVVFGALTFIFFQVLTRIPLLSYLSRQPFYEAISQNIYFSALFLGFTAAIFEEFGRLFVYRIFLKQNRYWKNAVAFGIGHGGIEAMLLVGMAYINQMIIAVLLNQGGAEVVSETMGVSFDQVIQIKRALLGTSSHMFLVAGIERMLALCLHIGLSVLVLYAIKSEKIRYFWAALLAHGLVNVAVVILAQYSVWAAEGFMLLIAIGSVIYVKMAKNKYRNLDRIIPIQYTQS